MIQPAATSVHATGRTAMRAGGGHGAGGTVGQAFAALLGGGGADGDDPPAGTATADDAAATDRQDDAAAGNPSPPTVAATDESWLSLILGGSADPVLPVADQPSGTAENPVAFKRDMAMSVAGSQAAAAAPSVVDAAPRLVADQSSDRARPVPASMLAADPSSNAATVTEAAGTMVRAPDVDREQTRMVEAAVATVLPDSATLPIAVDAPVPRRGAKAQTTGTEGESSSITDAATAITGRVLSGGSDRIPLAAASSPARLATARSPGEASIMTLAASPTTAPSSGGSDRVPLIAVPSYAGSIAASIASPVITAFVVAAAPAAAPAAMQDIPPLPADPASAARRSSLAGLDPAGQSRPATVAAGSIPTPSVTPSATVAPAGEVFAAAIQAVDRQQSHARRDGDDASTPLAMALAAASPVAGAVAATSGQGGATLDMRHSGWPGAMVEHIERLRDAADATDTRIRLVPDALGGIDVSLSRQADGVSVTLAADQPATRAMLADARPQLTDLVQARGLRLADANVGGGQGFADSQRRPTPSFLSTAPASATTSSTDDRDPADSRVA